MAKELNRRSVQGICNKYKTEMCDRHILRQRDSMQMNEDAFTTSEVANNLNL